MGLQGERTRGEKTKNFLMRRGIKQQGNTSTASRKDESWHQFLPKRAGNSLGMIDGCPSSAPASEQLKHRDTALLTLRNGTSQSPLDAWEDLRPCFKSQPFPSPTYLLCLRAWKACQDAGNLSIPHTEQTHVMGRLHKEPRLHQDFWWFFSCLFFYDPRSWGNITFRGKRLFFFFLALYLHILGKKQNIPSSHCANTSWKMVVCFCCATTEVMLKTKYSHCLPHHWLVCFYTFSLNQLNIHAALSDFKLQICLLVDLQTLSSPSTET